MSAGRGAARARCPGLTRGVARSLGFAALLLGLAASQGGCRREASTAAPAETEEGARPAAGEPTVVLDADAQKRLGLVVAPAEAVAAPGELEAFGRVLDPMPLADAVLARTRARKAEHVAREEYERVKALHRDDANASTRELEAASQAFEGARLDRSGAQLRLVSAWGHELAERPDLDALVRRLAGRRVALARLDLPAGDRVAGLPVSVRVGSAATRSGLQGARLVGPAPTTDPSAQGQGFLVLIDDGPPPGTALVGRLSFENRRAAGVKLPRAAVVFSEGRAFVYVAASGGRFERRAVALRHDETGGWLATSGLDPGDPIVVSGAALLLSSEQVGGEITDSDSD